MQTGNEFPGRVDEGPVEPEGLRGHMAPPRRQRDRFLAGTATVCAHLGLLALLLWPHSGRQKPPPEPAPPPIQVSLLDSPKPEPPGPPVPEEVELRPAPPRVVPPIVNISSRQEPDTFSDVLSDSQIAGATTAGEGGGGGGGSCDMARAVQQALRRDRLVRPAVQDANRLGKSIMLWNGDWVRTGGQEGKGLSAVREAIMWEVAFVPEACRNQRMHGLVLLSLEDGTTRFAIGTGEWKWSDLLGLRRTASER
jgi:hypothetical protein